jgi:hypothetical protein
MGVSAREFLFGRDTELQLEFGINLEEKIRFS